MTKPMAREYKENKKRENTKHPCVNMKLYVNYSTAVCGMAWVYSACEWVLWICTVSTEVHLGLMCVSDTER